MTHAATRTLGEAALWTALAVLACSSTSTNESTPANTGAAGGSGGTSASGGSGATGGGGTNAGGGMAGASGGSGGTSTGGSAGAGGSTTAGSGGSAGVDASLGGAGGTTGGSGGTTTGGSGGTTTGGSGGTSGGTGGTTGGTGGTTGGTGGTTGGMGGTDAGAGSGGTIAIDSGPDVIDAGADTSDSAPDAGSAKLRAHWKADGDFVDSAAPWHVVTTNGTLTFVAGHTGQAWDFSAGGNIWVKADSDLDLPKYSVMAWINVSSSANVFQGILFKENHGIGDPWTDRNFSLYLSSSAFCGGLGRPATAHTGLGACGSTPVIDGAWHHVAGTFDGTTLRLFVDGQLASAAAGPSPPTGATQSLWIGISANIDFHGLMDELRIYDGPLTPAEILQISSQ